MSTLSISPATPDDRPAILEVARQAGVFNAEEIATVNELFEGYVRDAVQSGYNFLVCHRENTLAGFACWGPTALSRGGADLYWIGVTPSAQRQGVGSALFRAVEAAARAAQRRWLVIWTSSRPEYGAARALYERHGCELKLQLEAFYDHGDDLCVYVKRL